MSEATSPATAGSAAQVATFAAAARCHKRLAPAVADGEGRRQARGRHTAAWSPRSRSPRSAARPRASRAAVPRSPACAPPSRVRASLRPSERSMIAASGVRQKLCTKPMTNSRAMTRRPAWWSARRAGCATNHSAPFHSMRARRATESGRRPTTSEPAERARPERRGEPAEAGLAGRRRPPSRHRAAARGRTGRRAD